MESLEHPTSTDNKPDNSPNEPTLQNKRELQLCMTGAQKHMVEKDLTKFFIKHLNMEELPLKGILKKRGTNFAFLLFSDMD